MIIDNYLLSKKQNGTVNRFDPPPLGDSSLKAGYLFYSGIRPAIKVITNSGRVLIGSATHPVLVMDTRKGRVEYVPLSKLRAQHHSIIGVVSDGNPYQFLSEQKQERVRSMLKKGFT